MSQAGCGAGEARIAELKVGRVQIVRHSSDFGTDERMQMMQLRVRNYSPSSLNPHDVSIPTDTSKGRNCEVWKTSR